MKKDTGRARTARKRKKLKKNRTKKETGRTSGTKSKKWEKSKKQDQERNTKKLLKRSHEEWWSGYEGFPEKTDCGGVSEHHKNKA